MLAEEEEEANAHHIGNGEHVIVHVIRGVSVMQDGAHNCNGNGCHLFRWSISFGGPLKLLANMEVDVSVAIHLDFRGPHPFVCLTQLARHQKLSQTVWAHSWL